MGRSLCFHQHRGDEDTYDLCRVSELDEMAKRLNLR